MRAFLWKNLDDVEAGAPGTVLIVAEDVADAQSQWSSFHTNPASFRAELPEPSNQWQVDAYSRPEIFVFPRYTR